jgi:ribosomal protein S18 acetylase RimI-like enzyme
VSLAGDRGVHLASADDSETVARLLHDFNSEFDDFTPGVDFLTLRYRELISSETLTVFLAGPSEEPLGFAQVRLLPAVLSDALGAYLEELYVVPPRRGEGIGRALLEATMAYAREAGADHIDLNTSEDDHAAMALYESVGFTNREGRPNGPRMYYFERGL